MTGSEMKHARIPSTMESGAVTALPNAILPKLYFRTTGSLLKDTA